MEQFAPLEIVPGYMTHQTPRSDAQGQCVRDRAFHTRDWDYLGWRYSVISSIGTAPFNNVVDLLPARDETEFKHFRPEDQQWLRQWMEWTDEHRAMLQNLRPIIGPPVLGRVDGTAADRRRPRLRLPLQPELPRAGRRVHAGREHRADQGRRRSCCGELYPRGGRWRGKPHAGLMASRRQGQPADQGPGSPRAGSGAGQRGPASRAAGRRRQGRALTATALCWSGVEGETGRTVELAVLLPPRSKIAQGRREWPHSSLPSPAGQRL